MPWEAVHETCFLKRNSGEQKALKVQDKERGNGVSEIDIKERITTPGYYVAKYLVLNKYAYCVHRMC